MAYVVAVCGAGGKSTLCKKKAQEYLDNHNKVAVLTTTHMWNENDISDIRSLSSIDSSKVYYFGTIDGEKIGPVSQADYDKICEEFDYVIIEADGSRMMPLKVLSESEPVIPKNVDEIVVTMGLHSIGREIGSVCHRYSEYGEKVLGYRCDERVTEDMIDRLIDICYVKPLTVKYKDAKIVVEKIDFRASKNYQRIKKLAIVLCASGFSKRFGGENKLLTKVNIKSEGKSSAYAKELYKIMIDKLLESRKRLDNKFKDELSYDALIANVAVVSQYSEILEDKEYIDKVTMIKNDNAVEGLSSSIKLAINKFKDYDAIMFLNADIPKLPADEITLFLYNSILSDNGLSSMYTKDPSNPAYFEKKYFGEILGIEGDMGPRKLLSKYIKYAYKYHISKGYLYDIDSRDDLEALWN